MGRSDTWRAILSPDVELLKQIAAGATDGLTTQVINDRIHSQMMQAEGKIGAARPAEELIDAVHFDRG